MILELQSFMYSFNFRIDFVTFVKHAAEHSILSFLVSRLENFTTVDHIIIFLTKQWFKEFGWACLCSILLIVQVSVIGTWSHSCSSSSHGFLVGAKWLIESGLGIKTGTGRCIIMREEYLCFQLIDKFTGCYSFLR